MTSHDLDTIPRESDHRVWFYSRLEHQTSETLAVTAVTIRREITQEAVAAALIEITQQHPATRASLALIGNRPQIEIGSCEDSRGINIDDFTDSHRLSFAESLWIDVHHSGGPLMRWTIATAQDCTLIGLTASRMLCDERDCASLLATLLGHLGIDAALDERNCTEVLSDEPNQWPPLLAHLSAAEPLSIPTLIARPPIKGTRSSSIPLRHSEQFAHDLNLINARTGASRIEITATILATVLMRHSGTTSIAIGVPARALHGREQLLPVPVELDERCIDAVIGETATRRAVYTEHATDLLRLIDKLAPDRDPSRTPIFQAAVADTSPLLEISSANGSVMERQFRSPYDLTLTGPSLRDLPSTSVQLWNFVFDPDIVDEKTAISIVHHIETLASSIARDGTTTLTRCPMLDADEMAELNTWSSGGPAVATTELLHTHAAEQLSLHPARTAIIEHGQRITYGELNETVDRIRRLIFRHRPSSDSLIAVILPKSSTQVAAVLAVNFEGAAYLPIDTQVPDNRLRYLLERGRTTLVLTDTATQSAHTWPEGVAVIDVSSPGVDPTGPNRLDGPVGITPDRSAYVIFTSGSTGLPKGVEVSHASAANTVIDICHRFGVNESDKVLALSALNFDLSVFDIFGILGVAGTIVMPEEADSRDPNRWARLVDSEAVTVWNSVPALMELVVGEAERNQIDLSSLRLVMMSGDWIPVTLPDRIRTLAPDAVIISMGGATEAAIWSIVHEIGDVDPQWDSIPYGSPLAGQKFRILDAVGNPVPAHVVGELYIGGVGVAKGYWRDTEKTSAAFVTTYDGSRWYRTGDYGKYGYDGVIKFLGRRDTQVKVNGYRIELTEIDHNFREHPDVREAHSTVRDDDGVRRVVTYIVPMCGEVSIAALREFLRSRLPAYMIPSRFVELDSFPLTPNGKVDNKSLPAPGQQDNGEIQHCAAGDSVERRIHDVWCRVLQHATIGLDSDFFGIGGDSLAALDVVSLLGAGGLAVKPQDLFDHPTITSLAAVAVPIEPRTRPLRVEPSAGDRIPLTPVQRWFFDLGLHDVHHFNRSAWLHADGVVDATRLKDAVALLIQRHDVLKYVYRRRARGWEQALGHTDQIDLDVVLTVAEPDTDVHGLVRSVQSSIALDAAPLLRVVVFPSSQQSRILVTAHHLIIDGVALNVLCDELDRAYRGELTDSDSLSSSPFAAWARECSEYAGFGDPSSEADYWQAISDPSGGHAIDLSQEPSCPQSTQSTPARTASVRYQSDNNLDETLTRCATAQRVAVRDIVLAASVSAVRRWRGASRILIDIEGHGRHDLRGNLEIAHTIGWFTVIYPIAVQADSGNRLAILRRTRRALDQVPRHGLGYGQLRFTHEYGSRITWRNSDIAFNYLGHVAETGRTLIHEASSAVDNERSPADHQPHHLAITPFFRNGTLIVDLTARSEYADETALTALAEAFADELSLLVTECTTVRQAPSAGESFQTQFRPHRTMSGSTPQMRSAHK